MRGWGSSPSGTASVEAASASVQLRLDPRDAGQIGHIDLAARDGDRLSERPSMRSRAPAGSGAAIGQPHPKQRAALATDVEADRRAGAGKGAKRDLVLLQHRLQRQIALLDPDRVALERAQAGNDDEAA